uniref:Congested-like trachea protein n=1 Tax=Mesocestoides corti TaxID=53468 RepID=A0A5K3F848_MESCO
MDFTDANGGRTSHIKSFWAGGFGGMCAVVTGHPLDTIKVRLQTAPPCGPGETPIYKGALDCAHKTIALEGISGLYKGMLAPLAGATPLFAICFLGYNFGKKIFAQDINCVKKHEVFCAGMLSGVCTTFMMVPAERIKCLLQIQTYDRSSKYRGPVDVIRKLYQEGGLSSFYRGTVATLLRDVPASGVFFLSYEWIKELLSPTSAS